MSNFSIEHILYGKKSSSPGEEEPGTSSERHFIFSANALCDQERGACAAHMHGSSPEAAAASLSARTTISSAQQLVSVPTFTTASHLTPTLSTSSLLVTPILTPVTTPTPLTPPPLLFWSSPMYLPISPPPSANTSRRRKARTVFTDGQMEQLEISFKQKKYLSIPERISLAQALGLSEQQVKTWYQNRRTKWKRQLSEEDRREAMEEGEVDTQEDSQ